MQAKSVYRPPDWEAWAQEDSQPRQLPARPAAWVPPTAGRVEVPRVDLAPMTVNAQMGIQPAAMVTTVVTGDHVSRSRAWLNYSLPLSLAFGLVVVVAAILWANLRLFSWQALGLYFLVFCVSYGVLLWDYLRRSPEGNAYKNTSELWGFLRREQAHRHSIEREAWEEQRRLLRQEDPQRRALPDRRLHR